MWYKIFMEKIEHIFEPNSLACGQAVIAMVTARDVYEIIRYVGTDRETTLRDMRSAFLKYGFYMSPQKKEAKRILDLPKMALLSLETPECWHWSLYAHGKVYDPRYGVLKDFPTSNRKYFWEIYK